MKNQTELEARIQERLNELKSVPARNPRVAARARAHFLAQAVSANESRRHKWWESIFSFRKQQFAMNMVVTLLVIAGLLIGGGTTVKAAQDDLPDEPLYSIKTLSEDISLQFQDNSEAKADRLMELAQTRVQEMVLLVESGRTPPEHVRLRLEQHLQQTLRIYSRMDDAVLDQKLPKLHKQLQQQDQDMQRLQTHAVQDAQPILERTRTMLQTDLHVVNDGLLSHEMFRNTVHNGFRYEQTPTPPIAAPSSTSTRPQEQNVQATPQPGNHGNGNGLGPNTNPGGPNAHITPTPKNGSNGQGSGNNPGGNDKDPKDKDKGPDKDGSSGNDPSDKGKRTDAKNPK